MSLFLGKIHYWLFNKIKWFESLEDKVVQLAEGKGFEVSQWKDEAYSRYGAPTENKPLEDMIDTGNIHGWLQGKISAAEGRQAFFVTRVLKQDSSLKDDLIKVFKEQGIKAGKEYNEEKGIPQSPADAYTALNDYILEGMPCDRVNEVTENNEEKITWIATTCIHAEYWEREGGDVKNFYDLRDNWIASFVKELNPSFNYEVLEDGTKVIKRV